MAGHYDQPFLYKEHHHRLALIAALAAWSDVQMQDWRKEAYDQGVRFAASLDEFSGMLPVDSWRKTLAGEFIPPMDPRPQRGGKPVPVVSVLVDGKPLPDNRRFQGPAYWGQ